MGWEDCVWEGIDIYGGIETKGWISGASCGIESIRWRWETQIAREGGRLWIDKFNGLVLTRPTPRRRGDGLDRIDPVDPASHCERPTDPAFCTTSTHPWKSPVTTSGVLFCFMSSSGPKSRRRLASTPLGWSEPPPAVAVAAAAVAAAAATSDALTMRMGCCRVVCVRTCGMEVCVCGSGLMRRRVRAGRHHTHLSDPSSARST